jgi:general secretion pathway protein D
LLAFLQLQETTGRTKVISAPSLIATDSIPATMNVGVEVPTLTSTAATGAISGGNTQFAQTVQNRESGVTLAVTARINPSGVVTLVINQEVSSPVAPVPGGINSPSFSKRTVQTQVTLEDGDTIAIGGIIDEKEVLGSSGIPLLHRLPGVGALFGSKSFTKTRTELIIFFTPRVIYDTNQMADATEELRGKLRRLVKIVREREE